MKTCTVVKWYISEIAIFSTLRYRPYSDDVTHVIIDVAAILSGRRGSGDCVRIAWCYGKELLRCWL